MNPNERQPHESYKEYKERLVQEHKHEKKSKFRLLFDSFERGTYIRKKHGQLV